MELHKLHIITEDFRVRRYLFRAWKSFCFIVLALITLIGCDEDNDNDPPNPPVRQVIIHTPTDTLWFIPRDSATTTISVVVSDWSGKVVERQKVELELSDPQLGYLELLDTELRDTTNAQGRVELQFTAIGTAGDELFSATVGNIFATHMLPIRAIPTVIEVDFPYFNYPDDADSIKFDVIYSTDQGIAIAGQQLNSSSALGIRTELSPTDETGRATGIFFRTYEFGVFYVTVTDGYATDTDSISIVSLCN